MASIAYGNYDLSNIEVVTLTDHKSKILLDHAGMYPRYLPSGHLVYTSKGTLFAAPFDLERLEVRGPAVRLGAVSSNPNLGYAQIDFSQNGTFVYRTGGSEGLRTLQWLDSTGKTTSLGFEPALYLVPRLSPDGKHLAYLVTEGTSTDLWVYDFERGAKTRVTRGENAYHPAWTRDGRFVVFRMGGGMYWARPDGGGKPQSLTQRKALQYPMSFSPDGRQLLFSEQTEGEAEIRIVPVDNASGQLQAGDSRLFLKVAALLSFPTFSPDGRWVAYGDAEGGTYELCVRAFPDNGTRVQVSTAGGTIPVWSPTENELFFSTEDQRIMVTDYSVKNGSFVAGKPRLWYGKKLSNVGLSPNFDLAPDGKRILAVAPIESAEPRETQSHVTIAVNYFDEVRRRVAGQGK
jgi:serine/threonine-protein kinase